LLWEHFRELIRDPDLKKRGTDYGKLLTDSEQAADVLRLLLADATSSPAARDVALQNTAKTCGACHQTHRN
jgi:cytochrome c556